MAKATTWTGVQVKIQSALAAADTISGITKASPAVVSATAHGLANGDYVVLDVQGMSQVDGRVFKVGNVATDSFELVDEDSTEFSTFVSGTAKAITYGTTLATATNLSASGGEAEYKDITTIHDLVKKEIPVAASAIDYSFENIWDPADAGLKALKAASDKASLLAMQFIFRDGAEVLFTGYISATNLPTGNAQDLVKTPASIKMFGTPTIYAGA